MYVEAPDKTQVESWVGEVRKLRYKDFQLVTRPGELAREDADQVDSGAKDKVDVGLSEVDSVKKFGTIMGKRGVWNWWRKGMGYA